MEQLLEPGHGRVLYGAAGHPQGRPVAVGALQLPAVDGAQQGGQVGRHQVGGVEFDRLLRVDVHALPHRLLAPVRIAAVAGGQVANSGDRVVDDLLAQVAGDVGAGRLDRMRGAEVGSGRHHNQVRGLGHEEAGRIGPGAGRVDERDHRDPGVEQSGRDLVHRGRDPAGGVHHDDERRRILGLGPVYCLADVGRGHRVDLAVDRGPEDGRRGGAGAGGKQRQQRGRHGRRAEPRPEARHEPSIGAAQPGLATCSAGGGVAFTISADSSAPASRMAVPHSVAAW